MTTALIHRDEKGVCGLQVSGHSGYAEAGSDIICAAVSVLVTTCVNAMEKITGVIPRVVQLPKAPLVSVSLPRELSPEQEHDARLLLESTVLGLRDVAAEYPRFLTIK